MAHDKRIVKNEEKIEELKKTIPDWIKNLKRPPTPILTPKFGPLEGIRVTSTGIILAQPFMATKMADFGAEVIHIERPGGDPYRVDSAPSHERAEGAQLRCGRGNKEQALPGSRHQVQEGHRDPHGPLEDLRRLDGVLRTGTIERAGISNELALAVNPKPRDRTGQHVRPVRQRGLPGASRVRRPGPGLRRDDVHHGRPERPPPEGKTYTGDILTSLTGWAATLMALMVVQKTGQGQVIDCAQFEAVAQTQGNVLPLYTGQGATYGHTGNRAAGFQPYDTFKCKDGFVFIGAFGGAIYPRVPKFLGPRPGSIHVQ